MRARLGERSAFVALVTQRDGLGTQRLGPCELALHVSLVHVRYRLWLHADAAARGKLGGCAVARVVNAEWNAEDKIVDM